MKTKAGFWGVRIVLMGMVPVSVRADGKIWDYGTSLPVAENEQVAAIAFRDGIQKMILAVNFELSDTDGAIWIFPVPGPPDEVSTEVLDIFPSFSGRDPVY
jgi:hypothetical protein